MIALLESKVHLPVLLDEVVDGSAFHLKSNSYIDGNEGPI